MKRILSFALALVLAFSLLPLSAAAAENDALEAEIKRQLDAYADTIDTKNAGSEAVSALIDHAMNGNGENLIADETHPLTAAILNSASFGEGFSRVVSRHINDDSDLISLGGSHSWYSSKAPHYQYRPIGTTGYTVKENYSGTVNAYDESLSMVTGGTRVRFYLQKSRETAAETTWNVLIVVFDDFDFNGSYSDTFFPSGSATEQFLSLIGKLLETGGTIDSYSWYSYAILPLMLSNDLLTGSAVAPRPDAPEADASVPNAARAIANYAASVTPANAAEDAKTAIFTHAFTGRGADLNLTADSPVVGTALSSNLFQFVFADVFDAFVASGLDSSSIKYGLYYYSGKQSYLYFANNLGFERNVVNSYSGAVNTYDDALITAVGSMHVVLTFTKTTAANGETLYQVQINMFDTFDTDYDGTDSTLKDIVLTYGASALTLLKLMTPFTWYGEADFTLNDYV